MVRRLAQIVGYLLERYQRREDVTLAEDTLADLALLWAQECMLQGKARSIAATSFYTCCPQGINRKQLSVGIELVNAYYIDIGVER